MSAIDILIVEDHPRLAQELHGQLEDLGYRVVAIARSGKEAIEKTRELFPQIVLMNMRSTGTVVRLSSVGRGDRSLWLYLSALGQKADLRNH